MSDDKILAGKFIYDAQNNRNYRPDDELPQPLAERLPAHAKKTKRDTGKKWTPAPPPIQNPTPPRNDDPIPSPPPAPPPPPPPTNDEPIRASAGARDLAEQHGIDLRLVEPSREDGLITVSDVRRYMRDNNIG